MNGIKISLQDITDCANRISILNAGLQESLQVMKKEMLLLQDTWISDAARETIRKFNAVSVRFEKQKEIIDSYTRFLHLTVSSYDSLESTITANASGMQE